MCTPYAVELLDRRAERSLIGEINNEKYFDIDPYKFELNEIGYQVANLIINALKTNGLKLLNL